MNFQELSKEELIAVIEKLSSDAFTGHMNAAFAKMTHSRIPANKYLIMVDLCNVHAMNHKYTMNGTNARWIKIFADMRLEDIVIKWGGDEFVLIIDTDDINGFIARLDEKMHANNCYAVYGVVKTSNDLEESVNRADTIVNLVKYNLEINGLKPGRDEEYKVLESHVIFE